MQDSVAGQKERSPIAVSRLDRAAYELYDPSTFYAILLALRFGCGYSVASIRDDIDWSRRVTATYFPLFGFVG